MYSFDQLLQEKIKTGIYQFKTLAIVGSIEFCGGIEYAFMSILISIIKNEWDLNQSQVASLGSSFLTGIVIGNSICAFIADLIGRKTTFVIFTGLQLILFYTQSVCQTFGVLLILRLISGSVFGTIYPLGYVFITEVTEQKYRGRFGYSMGVLFVLGKIYLAILCFYFLEDFTSGNWRGLIRVNGIPVALIFIFSIIMLKETTRYYLNKKRYIEAFDQIDQIIIENNNGIENLLTQDEKQNLIEWQQKQEEISNQQQLHKFGILSSEFLAVTIRIWILYILTNLQNMSIYLLMPFLFAENKSSLGAMLQMFILELIFGLLLYYFIDDPQIGGRKKIIGYSAIILLFANGALYYYRNSFLFLGLIIIKLATRGLYSTLGLICCESYPLQLRSQGTAIGYGIGVTASIPFPFLLFPLFYIDPYLPFALMSVLSIFMIIVDCFIDNDKTQKPLEQLKED